jgi:hypothetical protein
MSGELYRLRHSLSTTLLGTIEKGGTERTVLKTPEHGTDEDKRCRKVSLKMNDSNMVLFPVINQNIDI